MRTAAIVLGVRERGEIFLELGTQTCQPLYRQLCRSAFYSRGRVVCRRVDDQPGLLLNGNVSWFEVSLAQRPTTGHRLLHGDRRSKAGRRAFAQRASNSTGRSLGSRRSPGSRPASGSTPSNGKQCGRNRRALRDRGHRAPSSRHRQPKLQRSVQSRGTCSRYGMQPRRCRKPSGRTGRALPGSGGVSGPSPR